MNVGVYSKAIVAFLTVGLAQTSIALSDGHVTTQEWLGIASSVVGAVAVLVVRNDEKPPDSTTNSPASSSGSGSTPNVQQND